MNTAELGAATFATTKAGLAAGTTTTITIANTVQFSIKGKSYSKSGVSNAASPTTDRLTGSAFTALAASKGCIFFVALDSSGTIRVTQGQIVDLDGSNNFILAPYFPDVDGRDCLIGYIVCANGSTGSAWTFGSSNWTATGMTATFVDCLTVPSRVQVS